MSDQPQPPAGGREPLTLEQRLRELHGKATPGPWRLALDAADAEAWHAQYEVDVDTIILHGPREEAEPVASTNDDGAPTIAELANAELIVALRNALPDLLAHLATLQSITQELDRVRTLALKEIEDAAHAQREWAKAESELTALRAERESIIKERDELAYNLKAAEYELDLRIAPCVQYLQNGETPAECIERNRKDIDALMTLLAQEKRQVEALRAEQARLRAEHDALMYLLDGEAVYVSDGRVLVNTNDIFVQGADADEVPLSELPHLAAVHRAHPAYGVIAWIARRIGVEPLPRIAARPHYQTAKAALTASAPVETPAEPQEPRA